MKPLFVVAVLCFCFSISFAQTQPLILMTTRTEGPPEPRLEAIALIDNGQFKTPGGLKHKDSAAFIKQYLPTGSKFFVVFGGGAAGTINLTSTGLGCNDLIYAIGPFNLGSLGIARIHGQVQGLATNSDRIARSEIWRRAPSAEEREAAVGLAKTAFAGNGVAAAQLAKMETVNLTAIDVDADNRAELVGTFLVAAGANTTPRYLFLIVEGEGANYKTVYSSYHYFPKSEVYNSGAETLIDYADLDQDGIAEIVTNYSGVKAGGYHIFRRNGGTWKIVYENFTDFCLSEGGD